MIIGEGNEIWIEQNGTIVIDANSTLNILSGGLCWVKSGGILRIKGANGKLHLQSGARLILDPGAIVILESPESNIRIEGTLVWNGDINFSGFGYFDFESTHTLELNADALRLTGAGKENRFIRIGIETIMTIPEDKGLDLEKGAIEHRGYEIQLDEASWCNLTEVKMYGDALNGLLGDQVGDIVIEDCTFDGITYPINITGADNAGIFFGPASQIKSSDFHNYETGVHFRDRIGVSFEDCQFFGTTGTAPQTGIFSEFNFVTYVKDCTISDHNAGVLDAANNWADPLFAGDAGIGIKVEGGWILWMDGGEINNCEIGIGNLVLDPVNGAPTNIYMNHFATIRSCHSGIVMNGDASAGLVMMDCARILEIENAGIYGEDITLVIDPLLLLQMSGGTNIADPNVFTRQYVQGPPNKFLNVCYVDQTPSNPLPAKLNFWGNSWGGTTYVDNNPNASISLKTTSATSVPCNTSFPADVSQALQSEPLGCARQFGSLTPDECAIQVISGEPTTVRQAFRTGLEQINNKEFENAHSTYGDIAGLWQPITPGFTNFCETLVDASKSLSMGESRNQPMAQSSGRLELFPNPASGEVTVSLPAEVCQVRIWDAYGKLVQESFASGIYHMNVSGWPNGLYLLDIAKPGNTSREQLKMVVQR